VWAVEHVDEGIELLTGHPAGARGPDGAYPAACIDASKTACTTTPYDCASSTRTALAAARRRTVHSA
jgi:hypothetical protein